MSVTSISRDSSNNVSIARMTSNDTIATITSAGYITNQQNTINGLNMGPWQWFITDFIACRASDGNVILTFTDATFSTVQQYGGSGGMFLPLAGGTMSGDIDMGNNQITDMADPSLAQDAATKAYVDAHGGATPTQVQNNDFNSGTDTGVADAYVVALSPVITLGSSVFYVIFTPANANATLDPTLDVNGTGALLIVLSGGDNVAVDDLDPAFSAILAYDPPSNQYVLMNPAVSNGNLFDIQTSAYVSADDQGSVNAYSGSYLNLNSVVANNQILTINNLSASNTGASTFATNQFSALPILSNFTLAGLTGGEMIAGGSYTLVYNSSLLSWILLNPFVSGGGGSVTATQVQQGQFNLGVDSGIADAYNVALTPSAVSLTGGMLLAFKPLHSNLTTNPTVTVDGHNAAIFLPNSNNVAPGDLNQSYMSFLQYDGNNGYFVLMNPISSWVNAGNVQYNIYSSAQDSGAVNALIFNNPYVVQSTTQPGQVIWITWAANTNTGATTISNGIWTENVVLPGNVALSGGEIIQYQPYFFVFNNVYGAFVLMNSSVSPGIVYSPQLQKQIYTYAVDSGAADAYIAAFTPPYAALTDGMRVSVRISNTNLTTTPTLTVDGLTTTVIVGKSGVAVAPGDLLINVAYDFQYNSALSAYQLI